MPWPPNGNSSNCGRTSDPRGVLDRAGDALENHDYGVCVHGGGVGTRSASLIALGADGGGYRYADGPSRRTAFETVEAEI